ncbi:hypothetical protein PG990_014871 [Apiospora arundinis]
MVSLKKRKVDDDFIGTISDNDDIPIEEEPLPAAPPKKKSKTKKSKKGAKQADSDAEEEEGGIWGKKDDDDGAMDSDFEFMIDNTGDIMGDEFEGWGFDRAKKGMNERKQVDIDDIIRRRREKKEAKEGKKKPALEADNTPEEEADDADFDLEDDEDGVLADDAFGMGADSDAENSDGGVADEMDEDQDEDENEEGQDDDAEASDDDSVATAVEHPDDNASDSDASDVEEDAEEAAKREAFFAPEEKSKDKKQKTSFQGMSLSRPILRGLTSVGFSKPTPIQGKAIPIALEGRDVVGGAETGSGKTAAFIVPILERLLYRPKKVPTTRVVIMTPTRELAIQCHSVATKLASHTDIKFCLAVGGLSLKVQEAELRLRPDVVIATPGRLIDHMRNSASFNVDTVEILILDEADRMLEDGFADELNEVLTTLPKSRQTMLFSATMTSSVDSLIRVGMNKPVRLMVDSQNKTVQNLEQKFIRLRPGREDKRLGYLVHVCKTMYTERVIVFFRQKKDAHRTRIIFGLLGMSCGELHGSMNQSQSQRMSSVEGFRDGNVNFLLATDLASRGLDIKGIDTVINYEAPQKVEIYVHRVGRTARAGRSGVAVTLAAEPDRKVVKAAVKAAKAQGAKIGSLVIEASDADKWQKQIDEMEDEIDAIMQEEKEEKQMANAEMQIKKGENMVMHEDEIKSRPRRTWFESQDDKKKARDAGRAELNGLKEGLMKKSGGKLSNKDRKKLDDKTVRSDERSWKKGAAERSGKGAVLNFKKDKSKSKKGGSRVKKRQHHDFGKSETNEQHFFPTTTPPYTFERCSNFSPSAYVCSASNKAKKEGHRSLSVRPVRLANLAPPPPVRRFLPPQPRARNRTSLLRYLFPQSVRDRYRERLIGFHLDTLPDFKHRFQHRVYRFILERQRRRREQSRLFDRARRLLLGPPKKLTKPSIPKYLRDRHALQKLQRPSPSSSSIISKTATDSDRAQVKERIKRDNNNNGTMSSYLSSYGSAFGIGSGAAGAGEETRERGSRRKRLQAAAGRVYSAGAAAMNEIKESYNQTRTDQFDEPESAKITIPGSFPDVKIVSRGNEQLVLFPSYAKRHVKGSCLQYSGPGGPPGTAAVPVDEEDFWRLEWAKHEDERAIVDVDVRGWVYNPHKAPISRRNRLMIGLARQLSGIPAPTPRNAPEPSLASIHQQREEEREQARIARKAQEIEKRGQGEKEVAQTGGYSEQPRDTDSEEEGDGRHHLRSKDGTVSPPTAPGSPVMGARRSNTGADLNETELAVANANLMARLGPFLTTPLAEMPITVFFYNDTTSQSRTVITNDSGHFVLRAALEFVPTHVRILADEDLNCEEPVQIIEPKGISLISDIDDTIKHSSISSGTKEIFRNTFIRDLSDLTVQGVKEWYGGLHDLGVRIHYCSNSPWQLYPVIASYFKLAGLPPGSIHLKQYSGMLQGIFEPVAERKKGTLEKIMNDFPDRKFLLVGDSGEADLEVYADVAEAHPGRIIGVFIRDVTTPEQSGYFDSAMNSAGQRRTLAHKTSRLRRRSTDDGSPRPTLPPRATTESPHAQGPVMGDLIDLSDEPSQLTSSETRQFANLNLGSQNAGKKPPPPRPAKPVSLKSSPATPTPPQTTSKPSSLNGRAGNHPLTQMHNSSQQSQHDLSRTTSSNNTDRRPSATSTTSASSRGPAPPPPPPRRRGTPTANSLSLSPKMMAAKQRRGTGNSDLDNIENLPPAAFTLVTTITVAREARRERLEHEGVALYTWRRGEDVIREADGLVRGAMRDMGIQTGEGEKGGLSKKAHEG